MATKFGQLPFGDITPAEKIAVVMASGKEYVRDDFAIESFTSTPYRYQQFADYGMNIVLTLNWLSTAGGPVPFPTDLSLYQDKLEQTLDTIPAPEIVCIENEEINHLFHTGTMEEYLAELAVAIDVCHARFLKVTNGGLTTRALCFTRARAYYLAGDTAAGDDFAQRCVPESFWNAVKLTGTSESVNTLIAKCFQLLDGFAALDLDYVNLHFYEPLRLRGTGEVDSTIDEATAGNELYNSAIEEIAAWVTAYTGKPCMSNEIGTMHVSGELVTSLMQACHDADLEYAIWFNGGSGEGGEAMPLNDAEAPYPPNANGIAFRDFVPGETGSEDPSGFVPSFENLVEAKNMDSGLSEFVWLAPISWFRENGIKKADPGKVVIEEDHEFLPALGFIKFLLAPRKSKLAAVTVGDAGLMKFREELEFFLPGSYIEQHETMRHLLNEPLIVLVSDAVCSPHFFYQLGSEDLAAYCSINFSTGTTMQGNKGYLVQVQSDTPAVFLYEGIIHTPAGLLEYILSEQGDQVLTTEQDEGLLIEAAEGEYY